MATQTDALASVYAHSLFDLANQAGGGEKVAETGDELEQICELARGDQQFREFLHSPIIDKDKRGASLQAILQDRVSDLALRFMLVLNAKERLGHLEPIAGAFDQLVQASQGRVEVDLFTAAPLGGEQLAALGERIKAAIGKEPVLHAYTEQAMIGGVKLRIGDQLIDGSVATRLRRMRGQLLSGSISGSLDNFIEEDPS